MNLCNIYLYIMVCDSFLIVYFMFIMKEEIDKNFENFFKIIW